MCVCVYEFAQGHPSPEIRAVFGDWPKICEVINLRWSIGCDGEGEGLVQLVS